MDAKELVERMDARLYRSRIAISAIIPGAVEPVRGTFHAKPEEIQLANGSFIALDVAFRCQITDAIRVLAEDEQIGIHGEVFGLVRRIPDQGDESGHVILQLRRVQAPT